ncbi:hypothetical protein [Flammeovirga aprica]|uniref:Uncharacterized protein n=1 Tax=Flammeovirga aprica JL-4 TaxID=694437 RepID=A0A7X9RWC0_9BACT|nr:hypothetical protein [Flammeovirga aprica]NME69922.1 hypothetical protein [Flammeovirga aprica JL-4]
MKKYFLLLSLSLFCFSQNVFSQHYQTNQKLLAEKESQLKQLQKEFSIDSVSFKSLIYGLERQIKSIETEKDSVQLYLASVKPENNAVGIFKKDISITNKIDKKDYYFDEGETVFLTNHSQHTYTFLNEKGLQFTINRKYIKPQEGKKKTTSLIAQYQNKMEDYDALVASLPTQEWYQYDINRVRKERDNYQSQYDEMLHEIKKLKEEIQQLQSILNLKTTI